jgi:dTDP-4-dehydrorhamnose 3,5-epimerase|tara:strand:- start:300 stop:782 length:483 start_codon:yes stop_codon:yes gene_type:complete
MLFSEVKIFEADMFREYRGDIWTTYKKNTFPVDLNFVHDKFSSSRKNVIRGIHGDYKTWKLVSCLQGELYFVVVDNRQESKNYLKWDCMMLDDKDRRQVLLPPGFGNGFCVMSDSAVFSYKLAYEGQYSDVDQQFTLKWNDTRVSINWPIDNPILQARDK